MAQIETPDRAMRLARAIAGDIALYNEAKIKEGIENDNLFELIEAEIEEGLSLYKSRVSPELFGSSNYYYRAIVDVVIKPKSYMESPIWN